MDSQVRKLFVHHNISSSRDLTLATCLLPQSLRVDVHGCFDVIGRQYLATATCNICIDNFVDARKVRKCARLARRCQQAHVCDLSPRDSLTACCLHKPDTLVTQTCSRMIVNSKCAHDLHVLLLVHPRTYAMRASGTTVLPQVLLR